MRELNLNEMEETNGGIGGVCAAGRAIAGAAKAVSKTKTFKRVEAFVTGFFVGEEVGTAVKEAGN